MNSEGLKKMNPIFVVGMNGSGTTMLAQALGRHQLVYTFPRETRLLPYYMRTVHQYGDLHEEQNFLRCFDDIRSNYMFTSLNDDKQVPLPPNWKEMPRSLSVILDFIYRYFADKSGKQRWCEKTPMNALHIQELGELFPEAQFLHIIRDGRSCAASFHRRWRYKPERTIYRWKKLVAEARKQASTLGSRYMEVRYETITAEPELWMNKICEFLNIPFDEEILNQGKPNDKKSSNPDPRGSIVKNVRKSQSYFGNKTQRKIEAIGGKMLNELGYETMYINADYNPPAWKLKMWLTLDNLSEGLNTIVNKLTGKTTVSWRAIYEHIRRSLKQREVTKF